jgi:hypothetical protein
MLTGRCHCGQIRFQMPDEAVNASVCHCSDCRGHSGAPILAWAMVPASTLIVDGEPSVYASSETGRRLFCGRCGTGLFFTNAPLTQMGMVQVRIAALDNPGAIAPRMEVQTAERISWVPSIGTLPAFERFPG